MELVQSKNLSPQEQQSLQPLSISVVAVFSLRGLTILGTSLSLRRIPQTPPSTSLSAFLPILIHSRPIHCSALPSNSPLRPTLSVLHQTIDFHMAAAKTQLTAEALRAAGPIDDVKSEKSAKTATSSLKRKRGNDLKFYAVKVGKAPAIYHSWADCIDQVKGVTGAICRYTELPQRTHLLTDYRRQIIHIFDRGRGVYEIQWKFTTVECYTEEVLRSTEWTCARSVHRMA